MNRAKESPHLIQSWRTEIKAHNRLLQPFFCSYSNTKQNGA
nr:MAG TPA: hypothetical protein [Caudoviricetes sp.]